MAGSNWMFKKPVDEFEKPFRPRPSLPTSAYTSPRPVPKVPSIASSIRSVFAPQRKNKGPAATGLGSSASTSALSLRSGDLSDPSQITSTYSHHDAPSMPKASSRDVTEEEAECPVCLEPLSFSFRLPGEKPHIIPECGHALHEVYLLLAHNLCALNIRPRIAPTGVFLRCLWSPARCFQSRGRKEVQPRRVWGMSETDEGRGWGQWKIQQ